MQWRMMSMLALVLALSACGNSSPKQSGETDAQTVPTGRSPSDMQSPSAASPREVPNPCSLLTPDDIRGVLGISVIEPPTLSTAAAGSPAEAGEAACVWMNGDSQKFAPAPIVTTYRDPKLCDGWRDFSDAHRVGGLGELAYWYGERSGVCVSEKGMAITVDVTETDESKVVALARIAVSRL